jgi:hypothetical protein
LRAALTPHVPGVTLSLLSEPVLSADNATAEWYSTLSGEPVPLSQLPDEARAKVAVVLEDRLQALRAQADRLAAGGRADLADALRLAVQPPRPDMVYAVNGQPVLINWDRARQPAAAAIPVAAAAAAPAAAAAAAAVPAGAAAVAAGGSWGRWLLLGLGLLALLGLLWFAWRSFGVPAVLSGLHGGASVVPPAAPTGADETALRAEVERLERELRARLDACPMPSTLTTPPVLPASPVVEPPIVEPPVVEPEVVKPPVVEPPVAEPPVVKPPVAEAPPAKLPPKGPPAKTPPPQEVAEAPKPDAPPSKRPQKPAAPPADKQECPPPVPEWEAPEVVVLLDSSGSMGYPTNVSDSEIKALVRRARAGDAAALRRLQELKDKTGGPNTRLSAAKDAVSDVAATLPPEIDLGLVVFGDCKGADNHKFFSAPERPQLNQLLQTITPLNGTPLARGVERAGNMVDGVTVPAVVVVITDGEDSCNGDPCAAARALKARKPQLKINVIDVDGSGQGRCMAEATGGKVLSTGDGVSWEDLVQKATEQKPRPAGCK